MQYLLSSGIDYECSQSVCGKNVEEKYSNLIVDDKYSKDADWI